VLVLFALCQIGEDLPDSPGKARRNRVAVGEIDVIEIHLREGEDFLEQPPGRRVAMVIQQDQELRAVTLIRDRDLRKRQEAFPVQRVSCVGEAAARPPAARSVR